MDVNFYVTRPLATTTGGGGGGPVTGVFPYYQRVAVSSFLASHKLDLDFEVQSPLTAEVYIEEANGLLSGLQVSPKDWTIVRSSIGGAYNRFIWDSTLSPSGGNSAPIPDADIAPTDGLQDVLVAGQYLIIKYFK